mmetsp:Transcript_3006/g.4880  ORF Transcript_3006/g.4880 Transcript_3006/m.4880 type:complete len:355 (-) Transcript_3006:384-1448(-)
MEGQEGHQRPESHTNGEADAANRDLYGFRIDPMVSPSDYKSWVAKYQQKLVKRRSKWQGLLMKTPGPEMTNNKNLKKMIRKGVVDSFRGQVWMEISGASNKMKNNPQTYRQMLEEAEKLKGADDALAQIELDLHRTFPDHLHFSGEDTGSKNLVPVLRRVLYAYARKNPKVGYCQGMNFIAGVMLLFLQEEHAFWLLCVLLEDFLPPNFYSTDLRGCSVEIRAFRDLFMTKLPKLWKHFEKSGVDVEFFCLDWFICLFSKKLPTETLLRVWDAMFLEGYKILYRIGLAILQLNKGWLLSITESHELLQAVTKLGRNQIDADTLLDTSFTFQLKRETVIAFTCPPRSIPLSTPEP